LSTYARTEGHHYGKRARGMPNVEGRKSSPAEVAQEASITP
jgi:hypothetical protein